LSETITIALIAGTVALVTALAVEAYKSRLVKKDRYYKLQYESYNKTWNSLYDLELSGDKLWSSPDQENLKNFNNQLGVTQEIVRQNALLIDEKHYIKLRELLKTFLNFGFEKNLLLALRKNGSYDRRDHSKIKSIRDELNKTREKYQKLVEEIMKSFRKQIK